MGAGGGNAPTGLVQRKLRTIFLRAPYQDWSALALGTKEEFRSKPLGVIEYVTPTPVVLYAVSGRSLRQKLMVLTEFRRERLMEVGDRPELLAREGFRTYEDFRAYWRSRTRRPYRALDEVCVFRLSHFVEGDREMLGGLLFDRLYGEHT